ncbi:DCN1-like protein 5 isoform X1 [Neltuma alba]|uniref:DCN1-like protein 5 isoform X1 n=1 Tax=Neltuma alba TaxID=207710 RepID=UPI0010A4F28E|nr:DCN1-like protein 5 isoform X1 [Prosopis alba]
MRRSTSKKVGQSNSNSSPADLFRSASSKASSKESERIDSLFYSYANASSGLIDPEGIEALCADLEVDHTDVRILMLAWKMKAEKQGYFNMDEWRRGLKALRADTISKLKKSLPDLEKEVLRPSNLSDFYSYAFRYCLTEEKQKSIDIESVCELLTLVLGYQFPSQVNLFVEYLKEMSFLHFARFLCGKQPHLLNVHTIVDEIKDLVYCHFLHLCGRMQYRKSIQLKTAPSFQGARNSHSSLKSQLSYLFSSQHICVMLFSQYFFHYSPTLYSM